MVADNGSALAVMEPQQTGIQSRQAMHVSQRGLKPENISDLWRVAEAIAKSGLAPRDMQRPETIFVALEMGLEIGLPLMASLRSIAVINGRPAIWGDAALALVQSTGLMEDFDEYTEGEGENMVAVCMSKRRGRSKPVITKFSVDDAKRAGLLGKAGPWTQYRPRMLKLRARGFNLRDNYADVLQGLYTVEEAQDIPADNAPTIVQQNAPSIADRVAAAQKSSSPPTTTVPPTVPTDSGSTPEQAAEGEDDLPESSVAADIGARDEAPAEEAVESPGMPDPCPVDWINDIIRMNKPADMPSPVAKRAFHAADGAVSWDKLSRERQQEKYDQLVNGQFQWKAK